MEQDKLYDNEFVNSVENLKKNQDDANQNLQTENGQNQLAEQVSNSESKEKEYQIEESVKYKRPDIEGGYIYNGSEAVYFKAIQKSDVVDNCLLGDFDGNGNYIISKVIVDELVKLKKVYTGAFEKSVFLESKQSFDGYGKIEFRLKITPAENGVTKVVLEVLETVNRVNGYYQNTNHIAIVGIQVKGDNSTEKAYKFFNVETGDDPDAGSLTENNQDPLEIINILNRLNYLQIAREGQKKFMSKYYKELYLKKVQALSKSSKGAVLLEDFNKEFMFLKNSRLDENNPDFYKHLNQLMDSILDRNIDFIKDDQDLFNELKEIEKNSAPDIINTLNNAALTAMKKANVSEEAKEQFEREVNQKNADAEADKKRTEDLSSKNTPKSKETLNQTTGNIVPKQQSPGLGKANNPKVIDYTTTDEELSDPYAQTGATDYADKVENRFNPDRGFNGLGLNIDVGNGKKIDQGLTIAYKNIEELVR